MITKRSKRTIEFDSKSTAKQRFKTIVLLASTIQFSSHHAPPRHHAGTRPARRRDGHRIAPGKSLGWRSGSPKAHPYHSGTHRTTGRAKPTTSSTPATRPHATIAREGPHRTPNGILYSPWKGGDPAAPSGTATLLRLSPNHEPHLRRLHPTRG